MTLQYAYHGSLSALSALTGQLSASLDSQSSFSNASDARRAYVAFPTPTAKPPSSKWQLVSNLQLTPSYCHPILRYESLLSSFPSSRKAASLGRGRWGWKDVKGLMSEVGAFGFSELDDVGLGERYDLYYTTINYWKQRGFQY